MRKQGPLFSPPHCLQFSLLAAVVPLCEPMQCALLCRQPRPWSEWEKGNGRKKKTDVVGVRGGACCSCSDVLVRPHTNKQLFELSLAHVLCMQKYVVSAVESGEVKTKTKKPKNKVLILSVLAKRGRKHNVGKGDDSHATLNTTRTQSDGR